MDSQRYERVCASPKAKLYILVVAFLKKKSEWVKTAESGDVENVGKYMLAYIT